MSRYEIIIYWSQADEAFIAEVPELPGCAADGKSYKEALANVELIIQEWMETAKELGRPIPAPRGRLAFAKALNITAPGARPSSVQSITNEEENGEAATA